MQDFCGPLSQLKGYEELYIPFTANFMEHNKKYKTVNYFSDGHIGQGRSLASWFTNKVIEKTTQLIRRDHNAGHKVHLPGLYGFEDELHG